MQSTDVSKNIRFLMRKVVATNALEFLRFAAYLAMIIERSGRFIILETFLTLVRHREVYSCDYLVTTTKRLT